MASSSRLDEVQKGLGNNGFVKQLADVQKQIDANGFVKRLNEVQKSLGNNGFVKQLADVQKQIDANGFVKQLNEVQKSLGNNGFVKQLADVQKQIEASSIVQRLGAFGHNLRTPTPQACTQLSEILVKVYERIAIGGTKSNIRSIISIRRRINRRFRLLELPHLQNASNDL